MLAPVRLLIVLALGLIANAAQAEPFAQGDAKAGRHLVEKHCISCHASSFGSDGSGIYTREDRKVKNPSALIQQIRTCNTNLGLKWFDEEEQNVAKYLNQKYYKFQE